MDSNPYSSPKHAAPLMVTSENCGCPACGTEFRFRDIARSAWPPRLRCHECKRVLRGNQFIQLQGITLMVFNIAMILSLPLTFLLSENPWLTGSICVVQILMIIAIIVGNVFATLKWGRYTAKLRA